MDKITEKTLIPVSFLAVFAGFCYWFTTLYGLANSNSENITEIHSEIDKIEMDQKFDRSRLWDVIRLQNERLSRIEGKIDILVKEVKDQK